MDLVLVGVLTTLLLRRESDERIGVILFGELALDNVIIFALLKK